MSDAINLDENAWDDSVILQIYHETVKSHQTKGGNYKKRKLAEALARLDSSAIGEPGPWESCESQSQTPNIVSDVIGEESFQSSSAPQAVDNATKVNEALNKMLNSWYESGYATGRYYALREAYEGIAAPPGVDKAAPTDSNQV